MENNQYELDLNLQEYDNIIELIPKIRLDIVKEIYESIGYSFGKTNNQCNYKNYLINNPEIFGNSFSSDSAIDSSSGFVDYKGPKDGSIGSKEFPQGKGKGLDPYGQYWPFYTFGFGASPKKRPDAAKPMRSGVDCCKLAVETIMGYKNKGCKTIGDVICMYHAGMPTYTSFIKHYSSIKGINDIADGRFVSSAEMIKRQNYYQQHLVDYVHMPNTTPVDRSYKVLFPLITFISRQEQGVNSEAACKIALKEMGIT